MKVESLEQLQKQRESLEQLRGIVKTMKALSAASIHQYEQAAHSLASYYQTVERGLYVVLRQLPSPPNHDIDASCPPAAIVFGSDHGLCGRFNEDISRYALDQLGTQTNGAQPHRLLAIGARVAASLEQEGQTIAETFPTPGSAGQITATVQRILLTIDTWRHQHGTGRISLYYNRHSHSRAYIPTAADLLPVNLTHFRQLNQQAWPSRSLPTFSMDPTQLFRHLLHQYLFVTLFRACAESQASEHAGRLAAMQAAQRNLDEHRDEVTLNYRHARQNAITAELLDVVAGFAAISEPE